MTAEGILPKVSVVMPVYNAGRFLAPAVESILGQTFRDFEMVIIDDGSTDGSGARLRRWAALDGRIRLIQRENRGIGPTRNEGWRAARAELIAIMDADDVAAPDRLAREVAFLQAHPEVVCVSGFTRLIDARGRWIPCPLQPPLEHEAIDALLLKGACPIANSAVMMRRGALAQIDGYDEDLSMAEDYALWLKLAEVGRLANLPAVLVDYRVHGNSVSEKQTALQLARAKLAWERALRRRGVTGTFEQTAHWRPGPGRVSQHEFAMLYGWWAFNGGQRRTALVYGLKAAGLMPWRAAGWKLMACALLKGGSRVGVPD